MYMLQWLNYLYFKQKLLGLVALMSLCIGIVGFTGYSYLNVSAKEMNDLYDKRLVPVKTLNVLRVHFIAIEADILQLMVETDKAKGEAIMHDVEQRDVQVAKLFKEVEAMVTKEQFGRLQTEMDKFNEQRAKIIYLLTNNRTKEGISLYQSFSGYLNQLNKDLSDLADSNAALAEQTKQNNETNAKKAYATLVAVIAVGVVFSAGAGWWMAAGITGPIHKVVRIANRVAQGDLGVETLQMKGRDEIVKLSRAINEMVSNLKMLIKEINSSSERVAASAEALLAGSEHTSAAGAETAKAILDIHDGFQTQLQSIHETTRAVEEMAAGIQQIASGSESVSAASSSAYTKAQNGKEVVAHTVTTIESLSSVVHESANRVAQLGAKMKEIDAVIELITTISRQTNLLALNASIEAARAGSQGRGFGVVAEEVKKLAEQSGEAADKVSELVREIQTETLQLVEQINASASQAELGLHAAHEAGAAFDAICTEVEAVTQQIVNVSATAEQMSAGSEEILASAQSLLHIAEKSVRHTENVTAATEETQASMEEIRNSSQSLSALADELHEVVSRFKG
jgi:methyl-accepting chemotaxis protein